MKNSASLHQKKVVGFPNAKINLGLRVLSKRSDGYHDLETVFYPVDWCDLLEVLPSRGETSFSSGGLSIPGDPQTNLCLKAYSLLQQQYALPPVRIHLHKIIPMGAGLGGGSSDASTVLQLLNVLFKLNLSHNQLLSFALQLGSDGPFFIINKPVYAEGRGEVMSEMEINLSGFYIIIVKPPIHVSTAEAFATLKPAPPEESLKNLLQLPMDDWKGKVLNDFEKTIGQKHPEILDWKDTLYHHGAVFASMSGSGSALYGLFRKNPGPFTVPADYQTWRGVLK